MPMERVAHGHLDLTSRPFAAAAADLVSNRFVGLRNTEAIDDEVDVAD
jgi:hypothetical protein